ncbi:MAG TPA: DUF262 domain-containing HNH endonuclease family protein [Spirochaetota bacterium]|nr:DUF262 domain-containing HNH endonuclease family protein [Spirochaetota bacterium]
MEAGKRRITDIFTQTRILEIPFFQRSYVWDEPNWDRFIEDMINVSQYRKDYFMGSVILKQLNQPSNNGIGDWRIVVDGQQRLTTIILLFKLLHELNPENDFQRLFYNIKKELSFKHNHSDIRIFETILQNELNDDLLAEFQNHNILKCYQYFQKYIDDIQKIDYGALLTCLYFVGIDLSPGEDEQQIFDTINSLGVYLTTAELLKNYLFSRSEIDYFNTTWKQTFEKDESIREYWEQDLTSGRRDRMTIDLFLQSFLLIKSKANTKYAGIESLFSNYKKYLDEGSIDQKEFIKGMMTYAEIFRLNIDPECVNEDIERTSAINRLGVIIFGLDTTTVVPYILYVLNNVSNKEEQHAIFSYLESYLMRRLICKDTTKNYNNFFSSLIRNEINTKNKLMKQISSSEENTTRMPVDEDLKNAFNDSVLSNQQAKTVLYMIELSIRSHKDATTLLPYNRYSLEHLLPKKWRNNWKDVKNGDDADYRDKIKLKLGNLAIIPQKLNSSLSDAKWKTKVSEKGLKAHSSGIKTLEKYLELEFWNETQIIKRGKDLCTHALKIWPL